jgi:hypothetical protein
MTKLAGYGIKVQTNTGRFVWLTETGTAQFKTSKGVIKFDSETGADMYRNQLAAANPHATLITKKF